MILSLIGALRQPYLNMHLRGEGGQRVEIFERPGLWMSVEGQDALIAALSSVARRVLGGQTLDYGVFSGDPAVMERVVVTLVRDRDGVPIAFNVMSLIHVDMRPEPVEVLHLGLVMVDPAARARSLTWVLYGLSCVLIFLRGRMRSFWVSNVTQVPAVVGMVSTMLSDVWPRPAAGGDQVAKRSLMHLALARRIMGAHRNVFGVGDDAGFDEARSVITNAYTGGSDALKKDLSAAAPHRDPAVAAFCAEMLDYQRGDDLLQIGRLDMGALRRYLTRQVPRGALGAVLVGAGFAFAGGILSPVMQWADGRRQFGILRAAK